MNKRRLFHAKVHFSVISVKVSVKPGEVVRSFRGWKKVTKQKRNERIKEKRKVFLLHKFDGLQFFLIEIIFVEI